MIRKFFNLNSKNKLARFISTRRRANKHARAHEKNPDMKRKNSLKKFDFNQEEITFPITIRYKRNYEYCPPRKEFIKSYNMSGNLQFEILTGNEILLAMMDCENFNIEEIIACLDSFVKLGEIKNFDWNVHEVFTNMIDTIFYRVHQLSKDQYVTLIQRLTFLEITDQELWVELSGLFNKMHPSLKGDDFGIVYTYLMDKPYIDEELKQEMTVLLPREIENLSATWLVCCFEQVVDHGYLTEYNWEYHFHLKLWEKGRLMNLTDFHKAITKLVEIDYFDHIEWWNVEFLPFIDKQIALSDDAGECRRLMQVLVTLNSTDNRVEVDSYVKKLEERADYVENKLPIIEMATFSQIVQKDLKYYQEHERLDAELQAN